MRDAGAGVPIHPAQHLSGRTAHERSEGPALDHVPEPRNAHRATQSTGLWVPPRA